MARDNISLAAQYLLILTILSNVITLVNGTVTITSSPSQSSPAVFQSGENLTLTCSITNNPTLSWSSTFTNADGVGINPSSNPITGIFLHGHNTGSHTCSGGSETGSYVLTVTGTVIWYNNPTPGHLIHNNTAISVHGTINEIRCYSGDTNSGNTGTTIISPSGNTPLQFSNVEAGYIKKSVTNNVGSVNNGVYTCKYVDGGGTISESSFAVYSRTREPGSGSGNTVSLEVMPLEYTISGNNITVTCTSTGWPATQVIWSKDGSILNAGGSNTIYQVVMDRVSSVYHNVLSRKANSLTELIGMYKCEVKTIRHNDDIIDSDVSSVTIQSVGNVTVAVTTVGSTDVGDSYTLNCTVTLMESSNVTIVWQKGDVVLSTNITAGIVLGSLEDENTTFSKALTLSPLRLSHNGAYSCKAYMNGNVGTAVTNVEVQVPQPLLVLDPSDTIIILGTTVSLTCTVSVTDSLSATVTAITWYKDNTVITNGVTKTLGQGRSTLSLGTILSDEAGNYTCAAQISSPYIDDGSVIMISNSTNITVQMPIPDSSNNLVLLFANPNGEPYHAGTKRELQCLVTALSTYNDGSVTVDINILFNGSSITNNGRRSFENIETYSGGSLRIRPLKFTYLVSSLDTGEYTCIVSVTSSIDSSYVVDSLTTRTVFFTIEAPTPSVSLIPFSLRLPNHADYNQATFNCTGTVPLVDGVLLAFKKVFVWTLLNNDVTDDATPASTPLAALSLSTLQQTFSIAGEYGLSCRVSISVTGDPVVSSTNNTIVTVTGPSSPNKPINLTAVNILYNGATITWIVSSIAYTPEQYTIYYGLQSNDLSSNSITLSGSADFSRTNDMFSISLSNLVHNTVYYYHVTATNTEGSNNSTTESFKTREKPPTAPPTNFVISDVNSTALSFAWNPPPLEHRNGLITKYTLICHETVNGSSYLVKSPLFPYTVNNNGSNNLVLNGFRPGTAINCSVTASNEAGMGPPAQNDIITQEEAPAGPPRGFSITSIYSRELTVQWLPPDPFLQYGIITSYTLNCYEIESKIVPSSLPRVFSHPPPANVTVDGLQPFTMYNCTIIANNSAGQSRPASDNGMTEPDVPDGSPSSFSLIVINSTALNLTWKPVPDREQNGVITNYTIGCNITEFEPTQVSADEQSEMNDRVYYKDIYGLTPGTTYECYVYANSTEGAGPPAKSKNRTFEERPGSPPRNVTFTIISSNSINVKWDIPLIPNGLITHYTVYITTDYLDGDGTTDNSITVFKTEYTITGLSPHQLIEVQVSAWTAIGEGPRSNLSMAQTEEEAPGPVEGIEYHPLTSSILLVNCTNQSLSVARGIILQYNVTVVQYTGENRQSIVVNGSLFEVRFSGLRGLIPYNVTVIAVNSKGPGEPVNYIIFTQEGRPPPPTNVKVKRINQTAMSVSWTPIDITIARGIIKYYIITYTAHRSTRQNNMNSVTVPANQSRTIINNLQAGVSYTVTVNAATNVGEGDSSESYTVDPPKEQSSSNIFIYAGAGAGACLVVLFIFVIIIIVIIIFKKKSKSSVGYHASSVNNKYPIEDEKIELKDMQSLNGEVPNELEPIKTPELIPMDERMKPIPRSAFSQHVKEMHRDRDKGFELEYQSLITPAVVPHDAAKEAVNRPKNRFANIYPYDFSRVPLSLYENLEGSDYINASYMDGYNMTNAYIAAQGPLPNTLSDFWRMIWEHKLDTIVMLTKCIEAGKRKCEQYWPDEVNETLETPVHIDITLTSITPFADFQMRKFRVIKTTEINATPLEVTHWHFLGWPDHGCPQYATSLISFIRHVRKHYKRDSPPVLVHCSAGVGRTGTFILLDSMLERLTVEDTLTVYEFLKEMRKKRVFMVQTLAQYVFIHDALDELITCGETDIPIASLKQKIAMLSKQIVGKGCTGFESQYQLLEQVSRKPTEVDCSDGLQSYNRHKNRYPDRVPYNIARARLRPTGAQGSEYINASFVDGYKLKNAYIATQGPLQATVHDFWRMIWEFKSKAIVLLCNPEENGVEVCYPYWPTRVGEPLTFNRLIVTLQSENDKLGGYTVRRMEIKEDKPQPVSFVVTQFHFKDWAEHTCPSSAPGILTLLEDLNKVQRNTGNKSITVMCNDGQGRTGAFICLHAQQDRIKAEGVLDVFHFIKSSRIERYRLVSDLEQFIFCHQVLQEYYEKFDVYSNFK